MVLIIPKPGNDAALHSATNLGWFSLGISFVRVPCGAVKNPIALVIVYT